MIYLEALNSFLSGIVLPALLVIVGIYFLFKLKFFFLIHPIKFTRDLASGAENGGTSPFKALSVALAGTLGVGNISGVATAVTSGGAGAVFWMWVSAFVAMGIKYAEVALAVKYRKVRVLDGKVEYYGGAPYYIKEGLAPFFGRKASVAFASLFSALLVTNSLITGNIVQVNAASGAANNVPSFAVGVFFAVTVCIVLSGGVGRVGNFAALIIPFLSASYLLLSFVIIFSNISATASAVSLIFKEALNFKAAVGGTVGYGVLRAVRYGTSRGIFSNEAGCGTAPTAHAAANTKSPHHQACLGIFEVFCDTVVMCTATALVILIADVNGGDGISLAISSFGAFLGRGAEIFVSISVVFFALATVICQSYYGVEALCFIKSGKTARYVYIALAASCAVLGSEISSSLTWQLADLQIALMTILNSLTVFTLSDEVKPRALCRV